MKWTAWFIVTVLYKYVCVVTSNRKTTRPREGASWTIHTMNSQYVAVINDSQVISHSPSKLSLLTVDHVVLYYMEEFCRPLSGVYHITVRRRKGKGLVGPFRYDYYCGPIKDLALIQVPALFLLYCYLPQPVNKTRCLYKAGHNSRQYGR